MIVQAIPYPASTGGAGLSFVGGKTFHAHSIAAGTAVSLTDLTGGSDAAPSDGDIVIVAYGVLQTGQDLDMQVTTSGYTEVADLLGDDTSDTNLGVFYKVMGASPDTEVALGSSSSQNGSVGIHVWRGVDAVTPMDVAAVTATGTDFGKPDPPAITPVTSGAVIIACGSSAYGITTSYLAFTSTDLDNFLSTFDQASTANIGIGIGSHAWGGGAFDPAAWGGGTSSTAASWAAATMALRPA